MHELSIAQSIVEIIEQYVPPDERHAVREVKVKIGEMAGVVPDSLEFCYSAIVSNTSLQSSKLLTEFVPFTMQCKLCGEVFSTALGFVQCPKCESVETKVLCGSELQVSEIEVAEPTEAI